MSRRRPTLREVRRLSVSLAAIGAVMGAVTCGGEEPSEESPVDGVEVAEVVDSAQETPVLRTFSMDPVLQASRASDFPHTSHAEVDCAVCHESPPGHDLHLSSVTCAECHSGGEVPARTVTPEECQTCHHDVAQERSCQDCHGDPVQVASEQLLTLEVWDAPRERTLIFEHDGHGEIECASCHVASPSLEAEACASCHEDHHVDTVDCVACHEVAGPEAHDVDSHLSCSGAGCHRDRLIEEIATTRPVCLACHQDQRDHEPQGDCSECHSVRGEERVPHEDGWLAYEALRRDRTR